MFRPFKNEVVDAVVSQVTKVIIKLFKKSSIFSFYVYLFIDIDWLAV